MYDDEIVFEYKIDNDGIERLYFDNNVIFEKKNEEYEQLAFHDELGNFSREDMMNYFQQHSLNYQQNKQDSFENTEEECTDENNPYNPADVKYMRIQMTCEALYNELTGYDDIEEPSIILDPDFQRKSVWKPKDESLFIESILLNIPIPSIYVNETIEGKLVVADGRQRLTALKRFMSNELKLRNTEYGKNKYEGKFYKDEKKKDGLNPEDVRRLRRFPIDVNIIQKETPEQVKIDIFGRLNSRGLKLNSQELRNSIIGIDLRKKFSEIEGEEIVEKIINNSVNTNRYLHYELYIRYFAFNSFFENEKLEYVNKLNEKVQLCYKGNGRGYLDEYVIYLNNNPLKHHQLETYYKSLKKIDVAFGDCAFRRIINNKNGNKMQKSRINTLLYIVLLNKYNNIKMEIVEKKGNINEQFQKCISGELDKFISSATNNIPNILGAEEIIGKFLEEIYEEKN